MSTARRPATLLLALAAGALVLLVGAQPAYAATDEIESFSAEYTVQPSGVVSVTETIDYRFGSTGRHGIRRTLVTRERYDDQQDAVYTISDIDVSSPDRVSTDVERTTQQGQNGRFEELTLQIGSADETISRPSATYVISYDVAGAMRSFPSENPPYDEFYWDATGLGWDASIARVDLTVTVPGGVQGTTCTYGPPQSTQTCSSEVTAGVARFSQTDLAPREGVTIGNKIEAGLVSDPRPQLESDGSQLTSGEKAGLAAFGGVSVLSLVAAPLLGVAYWRRNGRDQRYAGLAPGTTPRVGEPFTAIPNDPDIPIPVAFSPPKIPVAEAGLLADGQVDTRETAATIIDLAVRGALTVQSESDDDFRVALVDPDRAAAPHEMVLLSSLFGGSPPGAVVDLSAQGSMLKAHEAMQESVRSQVTARGWFRAVPPSRAGRGIGVGALALVAFVAFQAGAWALLLVVPLIPIVITVAVVKAKLRRGQRTPEGRAVCDQVEGFRTYLATAEADQLRFEEGEDIFSRYLPWAIIFELADRWAEICADLVRMGRLPDTTPYWYYGSYHLGAFNTGFLTGSLTNAATPVPSAASSGTGFGGGSSFSGGGFSGGGGGGGGGGSW